jgi:hypothetical protein
MHCPLEENIDTNGLELFFDIITKKMQCCLDNKIIGTSAFTWQIRFFARTYEINYDFDLIAGVCI